MARRPRELDLPHEREPKDSVADSDLRIHGTDDVFLCSNANLPEHRRGRDDLQRYGLG